MFVCLFVCFSFFGCSMQDLCSPPRDWTCTPCSRSTVLTTGSPGKSLGLILGLLLYFYMLHYILCKLEAKVVPTSKGYCEDNWRNILSLEFGILCVCIQSLSRALLFATPWTVAYQAPLPMGFSRQEYWSELSFPIPGDIPNPGIEPTSPASPALAGWFFSTVPPGKPLAWSKCSVNNHFWSGNCFFTTLDVSFCVRELH